MNAIDILNTVLQHTVDADYTIDKVQSPTPATVVVWGHYDPLKGCIEDQLKLTLRTYFTVKSVWTMVNPEDDGYLKYEAFLQRTPAFARVAW